MKSVLLTFLVNTVCMVILYSVFAFIEENTFFDDLVHGSPYIRIFYLNAGVLLADVVKRYSNRGFRLKNIGGPILIATIIGWIVYVKIFPVRLEIKNLIDYILCLGLIYFCTVEDGLLSKALSTKWNIKLGEATMYLYLIHYPVRMYIDLIFTELIVQDKWIYGILEVLLIILFTGLITFLVIKLKEANVEIRKKKRKV